MFINFSNLKPVDRYLFIYFLNLKHLDNALLVSKKFFLISPLCVAYRTGCQNRLGKTQRFFTVKLRKRTAL